MVEVVCDAVETEGKVSNGSSVDGDAGSARYRGTRLTSVFCSVCFEIGEIDREDCEVFDIIIDLPSSSSSSSHSLSTELDLQTTLVDVGGVFEGSF